MEDISVFTVIEYYHKPLTDDSDNTEETIASISDKISTKSAKLAKETERLDTLRSARYSINQGDTQAFNIKVNSVMTLLDIYLDWGNSNYSLLLTSYPPGGPNRVFDDSYNKEKDGKIVLRIHPTSGKYIQQGDWRFTVRGHTVTKTVSYTFRAVAHIPL